MISSVLIFYSVPIFHQWKLIEISFIRAEREERESRFITRNEKSLRVYIQVFKYLSAHSFFFLGKIIDFLKKKKSNFIFFNVNLNPTYWTFADFIL